MTPIAPPPRQSPVPPVSGPEVGARAFVDELAMHRFAAAALHFNEKMLAAVPEDKLAALWTAIEQTEGAFQGVDGVRVDEEGPYRSVQVTVRFAKARRDIKVVFDSEGRIAGLFYLPSEPIVRWQSPAYAVPNRFTEREVAVGNTPALPGTLTLPKGAGPFPAVVLVHGSGPNDADESIGGTKVFKDLAWGLASTGVAVLRYMKRTRHSPMGVMSVKQEVLDGAHAAIKLCLATPEIDGKRVVVAGHSQGGELAPRIATENPKVTGIVVLAGPTRPFQDVMLDQLTYFARLDPDSAELKKQVEQARAFKARLDDPALGPDEEVAVPGAGGVKGAYFLSLRGYNPAEEATRLKIPILVLQGDRDYQVTTADLAGWKSALGKKRNVTITQYPALNHLFVLGSGTPRPEEYQAPGHVDEQVIRDIAAWIGKLSAPQR